MSLLEAALRYSGKGIPVFPVIPRDKKPLITAWPQAATADQTRIREWWGKWPDANIGIPTGAGPNFWVLDVDGQAGVDSLKHLQGKYGNLPDTRHARTGSGGLHILFRHVDGLRNTARFVPGLDTRADGGYIVAPPSIHASGSAYKWLSDAPIAPAPAWLLNQVGRKGPEPLRQHGAKGGIVLAEGSRNVGLTSMAGRLRRAGLDEPAIAAALLEHDVACCNPPLPEDDVRAIARSISRYERGAAVATTNGINPTGNNWCRVNDERTVDLATALPVIRRVRAPEFAARERPPRRTIISPWLREKSLTLLHAPRGVGKSWLALSIALAAAGGGTEKSMGWTVSEATEVVYIDAEMAADEFATRLKYLCEEVYLPEHLHIVSADDADGPLPSLVTPEGRELMAGLIEGMQLVIMDNVSTLWSGMGDQNAADSWDAAQVWLLEMRRRGHSIVLVDHSGKTPGRGARGTSRKEDIMDVCLELTVPEDVDTSGGAQFTLRYTKKRGLFGPEYRDKRFRLRQTIPNYSWEVTDEGDQQVQEVADLLHGGQSVRAIARQLSISNSKAQRLVAKVRETPPVVQYGGQNG